MLHTTAAGQHKLYRYDSLLFSELWHIPLSPQILSTLSVSNMRAGIIYSISDGSPFSASPRLVRVT